MIEVPTPLEYFEYEFNEELAFLHAYLKFIDTWIEGRILELENSIKKKPTFKNDEEEYNYEMKNQWKEDQKEFVENFLRRTFFQSYIVTIVSFIESKSVELCEFLKREKHLSSFSPIKRGSALEQAQNYFKGNCPDSNGNCKAGLEETDRVA